MKWVEKNAELVASIRAYIEIFQGQRPLIFNYFSDSCSPCFDFSLHSEEGLRLLLLYCALSQDISEEDLIGFLRRLYQECSGNIFQLNQMPFQVLQDKILHATDCRRWKLYSKVPGILRSVCDFFLTNNMVKAIETNSEDLVARVSSSIFYMGKSSIMKFKARLLALLIITGYKKVNNQFWTADSLLPITSGANRFMYFIGPLKEQRGVKLVGEEKIDYFNRFYNYLYPHASWKVFTAFDMYKKPIGVNQYECQEVVTGCNVCPVKEGCLTV